MFLLLPFKKGAATHPFVSLNLLDKSLLTFLVCLSELPCRFRLVYTERIEISFFPISLVAKCMCFLFVFLNLN